MRFSSHRKALPLFCGLIQAAFPQNAGLFGAEHGRQKPSKVRAGFSGMGSVFLTFCFQWFCSCRTDLEPRFSGRQKRSAPRDGWALCPKPDMPLPADGGDAGRPRFSRRAGASRDFEKERDADARDGERDGFLRRCGVPAQEAFINMTIFPVLCPFAFVQTVKKLTFRL